MKIQLPILMGFMILPFFSSGQCFNPANSYRFEYNGHTYDIVKENKKWIEAVNCALSVNGYLAEINDKDEQNEIFNQIVKNANVDELSTTNEFGTAAVWLGGTDSKQEGNWIWDGDNDNKGDQFWIGNETGHSVNDAYTNWGIYPLEPDNSGDQDKLTLTIDSFHDNYGKWNDLDDSYNYNHLYYIIEYDMLLKADDYQEDLGLKIYPNPFDTELNIVSKTGNIKTVEIYNILGSKIDSFDSLSADKNSVETTGIDQGVYLVKVIFRDSSVKFIKIVKE